MGSSLGDFNNTDSSDNTLVKLVGDTDGTKIGNVGDALKFTGTISETNATISTLNSTSTPLGSNGVFTGTWEDVSNYASICVTMTSDKSSATNGFELQFSTDGTNLDMYHQSSFDTSEIGHSVKTPPHGKYFRIKYTNTNQAQTYFRLQTIYNTRNLSPHTVGLSENFPTNQHVDLTRTVVTGETTAGGGAFVNAKMKPSGSLMTAIGDISDVDGQTTMSASFPVVIASDQSKVPIEIVGATDSTKIGNTSDALKVTAVLSAFSNTMIDFHHRMIHAGRGFSYENVVSLASSATERVVIITPASGTRYCHLRFTVDSANDTTIEMFEDTNTTIGTEITVINRNHNSANTNTTKLYPVGVLTSEGTKFCYSRIGLSRVSGKGGQGGEQTEYILKQNAKTLFKITSNANGNIVSYQLDWYEYDYTSSTG